MDIDGQYISLIHVKKYYTVYILTLRVIATLHYIHCIYVGVYLYICIYTILYKLHYIIYVTLHYTTLHCIRVLHCTLHLHVHCSTVHYSAVQYMVNLRLPVRKSIYIYMICIYIYSPVSTFCH